MRFNKKFTIIAILLVVLVACVAGGVWYFLSRNTPTPTNTDKKQNVAPPPVALSSHCGLIIDGPAENAVVAFPVTIHGAVDNNNSTTLGCTWTMFEGQAGTAQLYFFDQGSNTWQIVGAPVVIQVTNWMSLGPVPFTLSVNFNNSGIGLSSGNLMKITFTEEDPSGAGAADTYDLPLILQ